MPEATDNKPSVLYWVISVFLLVWGLVSVAIYAALFFQTPEEYAAAVETAEKGEAYAEYLANIPLWALVVAIATALARVLGAIGLLLRRSWALPIYVIALVFFLLTLFRSFVLSTAATAMSGGHITTQVVFVALSIFAIWFSHANKSKGILR